MTWRTYIERSAIGLVCLIFGFILSTVVLYSYTAWSNAVVVTNVRALATITTKSSDRWLNLSFHVLYERACPSWTQHLLYHDVELLGVAHRVLVPVNITLNSLGSPDGAADFDISFPIPRDIAPGQWFYIARTAASCEWLPGLIRQQIRETTPIPVDIK